MLLLVIIFILMANMSILTLCALLEGARADREMEEHLMELERQERLDKFYK